MQIHDMHMPYDIMINLINIASMPLCQNISVIELFVFA